MLLNFNTPYFGSFGNKKSEPFTARFLFKSV